MVKKIKNFLDQALLWLVKHNWRVIAAVALFLGIFEILEILLKGDPLGDPFHLLELIVYLFILALVGVLIKYLTEANTVQNHTLEILSYKHNISLELTEIDDWNALITKLVKLPGKIASIEVSQLQVTNPINGKLERVIDWKDADIESPTFQYDCEKCLKDHASTDSLFSPCCFSDVATIIETAQSLEFCLPITYADRLSALIQFRLKPDSNLSVEQKEIFESIRPEIALALKASQEQKKLAEMQLAETALSERHFISTYLHDNLSQNLAYLCLKLNQFATRDEQFSENEWTELQRMKDAANLSYETVRSMIETTHPVTTPHFVNLIRAYAKKVSQRANIEISVDKSGQEIPTLPEVQQAIFYVFQEVLSNVEKHARAEKVNVLVDWGQDNLTVTVSDDGIGFDPQDVDHTKHFGLEIMQERIDKVNGQIGIRSSPGSGTEIKILIPIGSSRKEGNK